ncbi:Spliceosomal protein DIB1 [Pichia kudriavzevii]|nr:Spliceosomal protein DIB1 [Pichia kudriavzevii]
MLVNLPTGWHVDAAILSENDRVVIIRFAKNGLSRETLSIDRILEKAAPLVAGFAAIYLCDTSTVPDFDEMYALNEGGAPFNVMFFWRNKHVMVDFGTGENNKMDFLINNVQELIDIIECVYRGAIQGKGLVVAPRDYSYMNKGGRRVRE